MTENQTVGARQPASQPARQHELDAPPWLRVESTLMATARAVRDAYDTRFAPLGLNLTQASMLAYVREFGPVTQTKIADHLRLGRAAIGATIDRLQERGLLERQADAEDRRVWRVILSAEGVVTAERIKAVDEVLRAELRDGITRPERQALAALLTRLQQNLYRAATSTPVTSIPVTSTPGTSIPATSTNP